MNENTYNSACIVVLSSLACKIVLITIWCSILHYDLLCLLCTMFHLQINT